MNIFITNEERQLIKKSVLLPMVLDQVEQNRIRMSDDKITLKRLYLMATELLVRRLKRDIAATKSEMWKRELKVVHPNADGYAFVCRSYVDSVAFKPGQLQNDIRELLGSYVEELGRDFDARPNKFR